jgi:hypothetical protein
MHAIPETKASNHAILAALQSIIRAMNRLEPVSADVSLKGDIRILKECAAVIARSSDDEIVMALQHIRPPHPY